LKIIVEGNFSSSLEDVSGAILSGVRTATDEFNSQNRTSQLDIYQINHQGNPARANDLLDELRNKDDLFVVIGGGDGNISPRILGWTQSQQIPYGIAWSSNPNILAFSKAAVRMAGNDLQALDKALTTLKKTGKKRWGLLLVNDLLGRDSYDAFLPHIFKSSPTEFVGVEWHSILANSIGIQYQNLVSKGADLIFMTSHPIAALNLSNYQAQNKAKLQSLSPSNNFLIPIVCSSNAWSNQLFKKTAGTITNSSLLFFLPTESSAIYSNISFGSKHPAAQQSYFLSNLFISALLRINNPVEIGLRKARWDFIQKNLPVPADFSDQINSEFWRCSSSGSYSTVNLEAFL
jgi:hypothetical protein